jgi:integrase
VTASPPSRTGAPIPTLADLLALIASDASLTPRQRHDICSALRAVGRALGRRLEEIPATPRHLRERLSTLTSAMAGVSASRWNNVLSLTRAALKHAGLTTIAGRSVEPMAPEWRDFFCHINHRRIREGLSRFARYCSALGIRPEDVNDGIATPFLATLEDDGLIRKPRQVHRTMCVMWNRAGQTLLTPLSRLSVPQYKKAYSLPWDDFLPSLRGELEVYLARLSGEDLLADGDFRPLRAASIHSYHRLFRAFLSALVHRGHDISEFRRPVDIVAVDIVKDGLRFFIERAGDTKTTQAYNIARLLLALARHWVRVDADHVQKLKAICRRLDPGKAGLTAKNRDRLRQFDNQVNVHAFLNLPQKIWTRHKGRANPSRADALEVQCAVIVDILQLVPMRIGNLSSLDLDRNIIRTRAKGCNVTHLFVPAEAVKNRIPIEAELPAETVELLDFYLQQFRPLLQSGPSSWLFPNSRGSGPKKPSDLGLQIAKFLRRECGLQVNAHLFRHIAAKLYLEGYPGAYGFMSLVHAHSSQETTKRFYCGTETTAAMRHFDEYILRLRRELPPPLKRKSRRRIDEARDAD